MRMRPMLATATLMLLVGACGHTTSSAQKHVTTSSEPASPTTTAPSHQSVTITPASGLHDGQVVHVVARGFTAGASGIGVVECGVSPTSKTGQDDCNIGGIKLATVDGSGTVTADFPVSVGPFGSNAVVCSAHQPCVISVTQLSLTPAEFTSGPVTFG
jgi:neocarzinostatin family protein